MPTRLLTIRNEKGLHARASDKFVKVVDRFDAQAAVRRGGLEASGASIMGLLMLAAARGTAIEVETSGPDADALLDALDALVTDLFGEGM